MLFPDHTANLFDLYQAGQVLSPLGFSGRLH